VHARSFALALQEAGWETSFSPVGGGRQFPPELHPLVARSGTMSHDSPSICIWHEWEMQFFTGNPRIAFPVFETTLLTEQGVHHLSQVIEGGGHVFTPSAWSQTVLKDHGIGSTVVPEGVDPIYFNPEIIPNIVAKDDTFTFVNVGKFEKRKGVDLLLNAYAKNFYNKDVRLLGLWSNPFNKDWAKEIIEDS
jgi:glycosyltransferase involved in cell wall biosynthesis